MNSAYLCFVCGVLLTVTHVTESKADGFHLAGQVLASLADEQWTHDEKHCKEETFRLLWAVKNHTTWATWVWDSMQSPVSVFYGSSYHLGNFDQCLEDPWSQQTMQYCLVDVKLSEKTKAYDKVEPSGSVEEFIGVESKHGRRRFNQYSFGVCLPLGCSPSSVAKISRHLHQLSHLSFGDVTVDPTNCQKNDTKIEFSTGFYVFWFIIFVTTSIAILVHFFEEYLRNTILSTPASWFSPLKNYASLTTMGQDELRSLNGLRSFSAGAAIVMHYFLYVALFSTVNTVDMAKDIKTTPGKILIQLPLLVDTFFVMSGLLQVSSLMTSSNVLKVLLKRYLRLVVPLTLSLVFIKDVLPHAGSGPLWPRLLREQVKPCADNAAFAPLMLNNFIKTEDICHMVTWYISCDYQLTILGTIIICLCLKAERQAVFLICSAAFVVASAIPAALTYLHRLPAILMFDIQDATSLNDNKVMQKSYIKPYSRAAAYLIGMALGYMMHVYKPRDYRQSISKPWSIVLGFFGLMILFSIMFLGGIINQMSYNAGLVSAYVAADRTIYAIAVCMLIVACEYGTFPLIGDCFTTIIFVPLSRLSFGIYLYHPALIYATLYSTRSLLSYNFTQLVVNGFGYIVVAFVISYLLWFIIEAPSSNCINYLFQNRKKKSLVPEVPKDKKYDQKSKKQS